MSKKQKYKKEYDLVAYRAIALTGIDKSAYESIGVSATCFYNWLSKHESFREAVERARVFHQKASPEALKMALIGYIAEVLENGGEVIRSHQRVNTRVVQRDGQNRVILVTETETVTDTDEYRKIPAWIAAKILPNASSLSDAIAKVLGAGYEVSEPMMLNGSNELN